MYLPGDSASRTALAGGIQQGEGWWAQQGQNLLFTWQLTVLDGKHDRMSNRKSKLHSMSNRKRKFFQDQGRNGQVFKCQIGNNL
jgi:hypothetical protein